MSKRRSNYETSKWYKFLSWVNGTVDYDKDSNETESVETERLDTKKQQKETDKVAAEVAATKEKLDVTTYLPKARELYLSDNNLEKSDLDAFEKKHEEHLRDILVLEEEIDEIERQLQEGHVERLTRGECDAETGMIFTDVVSNIERVADHATNIAFSIMTDVKKPDLTD